MTGAPDALTLRLLRWGDIAQLRGFNEQFKPGAFTSSLRTDPAPPLLHAHQDQVFPIGRIVPGSYRDDGLGPTLIAALDLMDPLAVEAGRKAANGYLTGVSVSFIPIRSSEQATTPQLTGDARWNPLVTRHEVRLLEVSLTPIPAYASGQVLGTTTLTTGQRNAAKQAHHAVAMQRALGQHPRQTRWGIGYIHTDSTPRYR